MPGKPRSEIIDPNKVGTYHCFNRVVQQQRLFGVDSRTGRDLGYRKGWVRDLFRRLAHCMAIDVLDYGVLDNHLHAVLRNRPDIVAQWDDEEVVRRWWYACPDRKDEHGWGLEPYPCELKYLLPKVDEYRVRISSISWMMRLATNPVARRANREDDNTGHFFAGRFKSKSLEKDADILNCSLYVDLNVIRAGIAQTPEESQFTSVYDRIQGMWERIAQAMSGGPPLDESMYPDAWLAPVFLDERADAYVAPTTVWTPSQTLLLPRGCDVQVASARPSQPTDAAHTSGLDEVSPKTEWSGPAHPTMPQEKLQELVALGDEACSGSHPDAYAPEAEWDYADAQEYSCYSNPLGAGRVSDKGFLPCTLLQYLALLDTVGRQRRDDKSGAIPANLPPILERFKTRLKEWIDALRRRSRSPTQGLLYCGPSTVPG